MEPARVRARVADRVTRTLIRANGRHEARGVSQGCATTSSARSRRLRCAGSRSSRTRRSRTCPAAEGRQRRVAPEAEPPAGPITWKYRWPSAFFSVQIRPFDGRAPPAQGLAALVPFRGAWRGRRASWNGELRMFAGAPPPAVLDSPNAVTLGSEEGDLRSRRALQRQFPGAKSRSWSISTRRWPANGAKHERVSSSSKGVSFLAFRERSAPVSTTSMLSINPLPRARQRRPSCPVGARSPRRVGSCPRTTIP